MAIRPVGVSSPVQNNGVQSRNNQSASNSARSGGSSLSGPSSDTFTRSSNIFEGSLAAQSAGDSGDAGDAGNSSKTENSDEKKETRKSDSSSENKETKKSSNDKDDKDVDQKDNDDDDGNVSESDNDNDNNVNDRDNNDDKTDGDGGDNETDKAGNGNNNRETRNRDNGGGDQDSDDGGPEDGGREQPASPPPQSAPPVTPSPVASPTPVASTPAAGAVPPAGAPAGAITMDRLLQATRGDQQLAATLAKVAEHPDGAQALQVALDKGTIFQAGGLEGGTVGLTQFRRGQAPVVTLEDPGSVDTAAHELAHAAFPDMPHNQVYAFGHKVAQDLGFAPVRGPRELDNLPVSAGRLPAGLSSANPGSGIAAAQAGGECPHCQQKAARKSTP